MGEWREYILEDLAEILNYKRIPLSSMQRSKRKGSFPYYGASGVIDYVDDYIFDGEHVLISEDGENLKSRQTPIAFIASDKFWVNNHAHIVKGKKEHLNKLLVFYFENLDLNPYLTGAVQPKLNKAMLCSIPIYLPEDIEEQTAIASVLSSLDDKIDLLHRQNATLEKMAETLFRQWFVEEAKEEWEVGRISDLIEFNPTRKITKGTKSPFLEMAELSTTTFAPSGWYFREFSSGSKFMNGDTLLARITPCLENGKTAYVDFLEENQIGWGSTEFIVMRPKNQIHPFFAYVVARNQDFRDYAESCMQGSSGRQRVDIENLKSFELAIPSPDVISVFNNFCLAIVPKLKSNQTQIRTLTTLRDTLLPKLMSGEVTVKY